MTQIKTLPPIERLNQLQGLDKIQEQFEKYRAAYKRYVKGEGNGRFLPHMAFMGNPGTGKTTIARLFAEILHEDGLLPKGQFVEIVPNDLISSYVGQTRSKTRAVCDRAKGGVLFIDEAYALDLPSSADFAQEAIEVLLQFMADEDSLVILAGYKKSINDFLDKCNPGLRHRFDELGFFEFEDYEPDVLFEILMRKLEGHEVSEEFKTNIRQIIQYKFEQRDPNSWGNAREMEIYVHKILNKYHFEHNAQGVIDTDCIPDSLENVLNQSL